LVNTPVLIRFNKDKIICTADYPHFSLGRATPLDINVQRHAILLYNQIQKNKCYLTSQSNSEKQMSYFRLLPRIRWALHSSELLCSEYW